MSSARRCESLRRSLGDNAHAVIVVRPSNVRYLTAFVGVFDDEPDCVLLLTADDQWLVTDSRYRDAALRAAQGSSWQVVIATQGLVDEVARIVGDLDLDAVALETGIEHTTWLEFERRLDVTIIEADGWVEALRAIKEPSEVEAIRAAQQLTDAAFTFILGKVAQGVTEREIALELEFYMRRNGSEGVAFAPIVASGPNSALPHAKVTDRALEAGDFLKLDFGARIDGYCADMTRTVVVGTAREEQRSIYSAVSAANAAGIAAVRPGIQGRSVDAVARGVISSAGYGDFFGHGLGHGVGLEVHERPGVGPRSTQELAAGAVVTIEPGIYLPGMGGVRIEDLVVVRAHGAEVLTTSTKDLIEL